MKSNLFTSKRGRLPWFVELVLLIVATVNLGWVMFDLSYIPFHDYYALHLANVTHIYDPIKGIEPHYTTENYLKTIDALEATFKGKKPDLAKQAKLLASLRQQSELIVDENPFLLVDKQGTLERIKNRIRLHVFGTKRASSKASFLKFWSQANFTPERWNKELAFFDKSLRPLFEINYYRSYAEDGAFVDNYWRQFDVWFMGIFALEFVARTVATRFQFSKTTWREAAGANSIDLLNLIPAVNLILGVHVGWLALTRFLSWSEHIEHVLNLPSPAGWLLHYYAKAIADEVSDLVVVNMIAQMQQVVQETDFSKLLPAATRSVSIAPSQTSTALNSLVKAQTDIVLNGVLPQVKPELEKFIEYKIRTTAPLPSSLSQSLAVTTVKALFKVVDQAFQQDPKEAQLLQQLLDKLLSVLGAEWRSHGTAEDLQLVLIELLEKTKQEYIRRNKIEV
ncbi:MAG: hypothetical protein H7Y37_11540 [Anaerolineae bacterium]|nr:hypothetical protein [Gloeobacterales cyanobacterium ES-bin-313]